MIITIGRQFGSGGSEIGRLIADQLQMPYYDKNIIDHVAERLGYSAQFVKQVEERPTGSFLFTMAMYSYGVGAHDGIVPAEMRVSAAQTDFILEKAAEGSGVFVGRCADYILKERPDVFNIFIYADMETRVQNVMKRYQLTERDAIKTIQQTDKRRAMYYNTNTQYRWGTKENYHLMLDSGKLGIEGSVAAIACCCKALEK